MRYSVQPLKYDIFQKLQIFIFCYMGKNIGKNINKNLRGKYSQKLLDHANQFALDAAKTVSKNSRSNWWFDWQ